MDNQEKLIKHLNDLLTKNYDAEAGYKLAAEKVENKNLRGYLESKAQNRYDFGHELKEEIKKLGGTPNKGTSIQGNLHRAWLGLKDALTKGDKAIYEEAVRGEQTFVDEYEEVLKDREHLPQSVVELVQEQHNMAKSSLNEIKALGEGIS
ncbi:MAG: ferritin-like domain-containing protein [Weeksellaceae bacterium]